MIQSLLRSLVTLVVPFFAVATVLVLALPGPARADLENDGGGWMMVLGQGDFGAVNSKLVWWLDLHARFAEDSDGFSQSIVRPAIGWQFNDSFTAHLGYGWIRDSPANGGDTDEHRMFEQLIWKHPLGPFAFQSRSRLEQRWHDSGDDVGWRLRQFLKLTWPIPGVKRLALAGYEEVFIGFNDTDWGANSGFDQNRVFVGPQWRFDSEGHIKGEVGYLNRYVNREGRSDRMEHLVSFNLFLEALIQREIGSLV